MLDGRARIEPKMQDLYAESHGFAGILPGIAYNNSERESTSATSSSNDGTTPMDLDSMKIALKEAVREEVKGQIGSVKEELNALRQNFGFSRSGPRDGCFECGKKGHRQRDCYIYIRKKKEEEKKKQEAGKASTQ